MDHQDWKPVILRKPKALLPKPEGYVERPPRERRDNRSGGRKPFRKRRF